MAAEPVPYRPIIGLEIHVQLATRTKLFCACPVEFGAEPNSRVCPVCLGLPGVLPVLNRRAYELAVMLAVALNCQIRRFTKWDRKSYYYPDLPKNYQISQYDLPLSHDGHFDIPANGGLKPVGIIRAHLEEDAGKNIHDLPAPAGQSGQPGYTAVDLNRAGTPLLEVVTAPDLASAEEAYVFATELQRLVTYLGVSEGVMQKGQMRFEPNVNLAITWDGREYRTPISEIKNLNSFRSLRHAIDYEIQRQLAEWAKDHDYVLEKVGKVNCGWRDDAGRTEIQRVKEEAHDYRYFPEPDLVPVELDDVWLAKLRGLVPELPIQRRLRLQQTFGLPAASTETIISDRATADLFEAAVAAGAEPTTLAKQCISFWSMHANAAGTTIAGLGIAAARLAELSRMTADGRVNPTAAAAIAEKMLTNKASPADIARAEGLEQLQDSAGIEAFVEEAIAANPEAAAQIRDKARKWEKALGFLQGDVMRRSKGSAPPQMVRELLLKKLQP